MHQKPKEQKNAAVQVASVDEAWTRILNNKDDAIENTFCYNLFEQRLFDEIRFQELCADMSLVLENGSTEGTKLQTVVWIISCTFRSVFSHYDKADLFKIANFDDRLSMLWGSDYCDRLRDLLMKSFSVMVEDYNK